MRRRVLCGRTPVKPGSLGRQLQVAWRTRAADPRPSRTPCHRMRRDVLPRTHADRRRAGPHRLVDRSCGDPRAGPGRYQTAVQTAKAAFPEGSDVVIVASGATSPMRYRLPRSRERTTPHCCSPTRRRFLQPWRMRSTSSVRPDASSWAALRPSRRGWRRRSRRWAAGTSFVLPARTGTRRQPKLREGPSIASDLTMTAASRGARGHVPGRASGRSARVALTSPGGSDASTALPNVTGIGA